MKTTQKIILGITIVFALIVAWFTYSYLTSAKGKIYLYKGNYEAGAEITTDMFQPVEFDTSLINQVNAYLDDTQSAYLQPDTINKIIGDFLATDVCAMTPAMTNQVSSLNTSSVGKALSDYYTSIKLTDVSTLPSDIREGERINIITSYTSGDYSSAEAVFQNVPIVAVTKIDGKVSDVTIELTPQDAIEMVYCLANNKMFYTLDKFGKYNVVADTNAKFSLSKSVLAQKLASGQTNFVKINSTTSTTK